MKTMVFTAQAFAFGPVAKMLALAEQVTDVRTIFFGTGTAYDLAQLYRFDEIYQLDHTQESEISDILRRADWFVNVMDFPLSRLAHRIGVPYFIVDVLLWFWPERPDGVEYADIYFCQDFFGLVEPKMREYQLTNARIVNPIVSEKFRRLEKIDQVIVSFGGMDCPFIEIGKNSNYPFIILKNLLPILQHSFPKVLVIGRERVMQMCRERFPENDTLRFAMLSKTRLLEELWRSVALFTAPGSETIFDAYDKLPIFGLPPQNNSNFRNLDILLQAGVIEHYFHWPDIYNFQLPEQCPNDEDEIKQVLDIIKTFENSPSDQNRLQERVRKFINTRPTWPELIDQQKKGVERHGVSGTQTVLDTILAFTKKPTRV